MGGLIEIHVDWFKNMTQAVQFANGGITYAIHQEVWYDKAVKSVRSSFLSWEAVPALDDCLPFRGRYVRHYRDGKENMVNELLQELLNAKDEKDKETAYRNLDIIGIDKTMAEELATKIRARNAAMDNANAYRVEVGVLMTDKSDEDYDYYAKVYDHQYGYYDEDQHYEQDKDAAIAYVMDYVKAGVDFTYGVVSPTRLDECCFKDGKLLEDLTVEDEDYSAGNVIYSIAKMYNKIVECFVSTLTEI